MDDKELDFNQLDKDYMVRYDETLTDKIELLEKKGRCLYGNEIPVSEAFEIAKRKGYAFSVAETKYKSVYLLCEKINNILGKLTEHTDVCIVVGRVFKKEFPISNNMTPRQILARKQANMANGYCNDGDLSSFKDVYEYRKFRDKFYNSLI